MDFGAGNAAAMTLQFSRWAKGLYTVAASVAIVWAMFSSWGALHSQREVFLTLAPYGFAASWLAMALLMGALWAVIFRWETGVPLATRHWIRIQAIAWIGRYLPGKIGLLAGKLPSARSAGASIAVVGKTVLMEQFFYLLSGCIVVCLLMPTIGPFLPRAFRGAESAWPWLRWLLASCAAFPLLAALAKARAGGAGINVIRAAGSGLLLTSAYAMVHVLCGIGLYFFLEGVFAIEGMQISETIAVFALANIAGVAAIFAPAGLGVREIVLAIALNRFLTVNQSVGVVAILRAITVVADVVFFLLVMGFTRSAKERA